MLGLSLAESLLLVLGLVLISGGFYGLRPIVTRAGRHHGGALQIDAKKLMPSAPKPPSSTRPIAEAPEPKASPITAGDAALIEELFSELFSVRATLSDLTTEVRTLRLHLERETDDDTELRPAA
jgi:hypothetical protein